MIPLFVDLETEWRGGQSQALLFLRGLYERGHAAELLTVQGSVLGQRARSAGIYVHAVATPMKRLRAAMKIRGLLADGRVELVHANEPHALTALWLAGAYKKMPMVVSRRVAYPLTPGRLALGRYLAAHRILAISRFVEKSVLDSGIPPEKVGLVYEGVEVPALPTPEERRRAREHWGISEQEILLGCVGYLLPEKGQELVVRALPAVRAKFPGVRLLLAGDGPCRPRIESVAQELGVAEAVIFAGFLIDVTPVYTALDAFVFPSLEEALGTSLLAAMAWGLPLVAVATGGVPEYVENGKTGLLAAQPDSTLLSMNIQQLLSDKTLAQRMGAAARGMIQERMTAEHMVDNTLAAYDEILGI